MSFQDEHKLAYVRDQLWNRPHRGACVLVGSGFSKNFRPSTTSTRPARGWLEVGQLLHKDLYPHAGPNDPPYPTSSESCPALAQEYESSLDRPALDQFLRKHIPDDHQPHPLHMQLLDLPWADVFTTNWDTLLERASSAPRARPYSPVYVGSDLIHAARPRIIKLHGSISGTGPVVVTQEDYRTYDQRAAPLSNTVRQALMEGVVLLLGFSGTDANFLEWHGWVRDHLAENTPRPFLAGYLHLAPSRRSFLKDLGIVPIDLAFHPNAEHWTTEPHRQATEWILDFLHQTSTRVTPSPESGGQVPVTPDPLVEPTQISPSSPVATAPERPPRDAPPEDKDQAVRRLIQAWRENRIAYPNWVVLPFGKIASWHAQTDQWEELILRRTKTWPPAERLNALRELMWRHEILMNPHMRDLSVAAREAVESVWPDSKLNGTSDAPGAASLVESGVAVLLPLLADARYRLDHTEFRQLADQIRPAVVNGSDAWHRLLYEECLWAFAIQEFRILEENIARWGTDECDAMWALRKAALLADMGAPRRALELAASALSTLEEDYGRDPNRIDVVSRLAWGLQWRMGAETQKYWSTEASGSPDIEPIRDLWSQLARNGCDAPSEWRLFEQEVREVRSPRPRGSLMPQPHRRHILRMDEYGRYRHAHRAVRMIELTGIPSGLPGVSIAAGTFRKTAEAMAGLGAEHTLSIALRAGDQSSVKLLARVLSPGNVAVLDQSDADRIIESMERGRDYRLEHAEGSRREAKSMSAHAAKNVHALARCISRAREDCARSAFLWAVRYGTSEHFRVDYSLWDSVQMLWERAWQAIRPGDRIGLLIEIMSSSTLDDLSVSSYGDPAVVVTRYAATLRREKLDDARWAECVEGLLRALRKGGNARERAASRIQWLLEANLVTEGQRINIADALWDERFRDEHALPGHTGLLDFVHLSMPEPEDGLAEATFRAKWIGHEIDSSNLSAVESTLAEVAAAWRTDIPWHRPIKLGRREQKWFWELVQVWLEAGTSRTRFVWGRDSVSEERVVSGVAATIARRSVPAPIRENLDRKLEILSRPRDGVIAPLFYGSEYGLIAAAAGLRSGRPPRAETLLRMGLMADEEEVRNSALHGLRWWVVETAREETRLRPPSRACIQDFAILLGSGREKGVEATIAVAIELLKTQPGKTIVDVAPMAAEGLAKWRSVLSYERPDVGGTEWHKTVVSRRVWCVKLARIMQKHGLTEAVIGQWIEAGEADPMAEVRYAAQGFEPHGLGGP